MTVNVQEEHENWEGEVEGKELLKHARPPIPWEPRTFATITKLNLPSCGLSKFPTRLSEILPNLSILFCPNNKFKELPSLIGCCSKLQMVSFKGNGMKTIHPEALKPQLRWLILTNNDISSVPKTIGRCTIMQKLMLSGNRLSRIPDEISNCERLELIRLSSNRLAVAPMALLRLPKLSWVAFSDNPFLAPCAASISNETDLRVFRDSHLDDPDEGTVLGTGASGITKRTMLNGTPVAVKEYKGSMTSDGSPAEERRLSLAASSLNNDCLIKVLGQTDKGSLVMELLEGYTALAGPPSFESCSRDVYNGNTFMSMQLAQELVTGLLAALLGLHSHGICHGDLYAHNILMRTRDSSVKLSDFGAAFFYDRSAEYGTLVEHIEMRSFGHLLEEVATLLRQRAPHLQAANQFSNSMMQLATECSDKHNSFSILMDKWQESLQNLSP